MTIESPLDCKEIQPVHPKGDQSWVFIGRTDVEAETPILWPPDVNSWLICKDPDAGKDWKQEKGTTEDEMIGQHHRLDGHGLSDWSPGVSDWSPGGATTETVCQNYWSPCILEPGSCTYWRAWMLLRKPALLEPVLCNKRGHRN